jgi:hypothetical protein
LKRGLIRILPPLISKNGTLQDFKTFCAFVVETRKELSNRQLLGQKVVINPTDPEGKSGTVAHIVDISAFKDGKEVTGTLVAVPNIKFEYGRRLIEMESFVLEI